MRLFYQYHYIYSEHHYDYYVCVCVCLIYIQLILSDSLLIIINLLFVLIINSHEEQCVLPTLCLSCPRALWIAHPLVCVSRSLARLGCVRTCMF